MIWSIYNRLKACTSRATFMRRGKIMKNISSLRDENISLTWDENISLQFYRTDRQITLLGNWCSCPRANILQTMSPWKYFYKKAFLNKFVQWLDVLNKTMIYFPCLPCDNSATNWFKCSVSRNQAFSSDLQKQLIDPKPWEDKGRFDNSLPSWATSSVDSFLFVGNKFSATDAFSGNKCQAVASLPLPVLLSFPEHKLGQWFISLTTDCPVSADFLGNVQFFIIFLPDNV